MSHKVLKYMVLVALVMSFADVSAQKERGLTRKGNQLQKGGDFTGADSKYQEALLAKPGMVEATYNWGNSLFGQKKYEEATAKFADAGNFAKDINAQFSASYNQGNALLKQDKYEESIEAYKKALRLKPGDAQASYNLTYALMKLRDKQNQQQNQNQQNQNQDQKQDQNKEQEQQQQQKEQEQKQEQRQQNLSKEQAEKMLEALRREEQKLQEQKSKEKKKAVPYKSDKDW